MPQFEQANQQNVGTACSQLSHKGVVAVTLVRLNKNNGVGARKLVPALVDAVSMSSLAVVNVDGVGAA
jgi:hypothetical protein